MIKRINEAFTTEQFILLQTSKTNLKNELGLNRLTWADFILHLGGVKKLK